MRSRPALVLLLGSLASPLAAQVFEDARLESRSAADPATLVASLGEREPEWLAWRVPGSPSAADLCCFDRNFHDRRCKLVGREGGWGSTSDFRRPPGGASLTILAEVEKGRVLRLRPIGPNCTVEGGGRRVVEVTGVEARESLAFLIGLASASNRSEDLTNAAMAAVAYHQNSTPSLVEVLKTARHRELRRQALFWLGQSDDPRALEEIEKILNR